MMETRPSFPINRSRASCNVPLFDYLKDCLKGQFPFSSAGSAFLRLSFLLCRPRSQLRPLPPFVSHPCIRGRGELAIRWEHLAPGSCQGLTN
jgi:hypothetical protein